MFFLKTGVLFWFIVFLKIYRFFTAIESYVVRYVKEQVGEVSLDFQEEMTSSPNAIEVDIGKFNLPDDRKYVKIICLLFCIFVLLFNTYALISCFNCLAISH